MSYPSLAIIVGPTVPDLRGKFIRGWADGSALDPVRLFCSTQLAQNNSLLQIEGVAYSFGTAPAAGILNIPQDGSWSDWTETGDATSASAVQKRFRLSDQETRPINISLLPCIKY